MKSRTMLLAAGFALAGLTAAHAESGYEPHNGVHNVPATKNAQRIQQLSATPPRAQSRTVRPTASYDRGFHKTRNSGYAQGYTTFEVLDSIR